MNADLALERAYQALRAKDHTAARRWAEQAVALAPQREEPWLLLSTLASPKASVAYLQRALQINPQSQRAKADLVWAQQRLQAQMAQRQSSAAFRSQVHSSQVPLSPADLVVWSVVVLVLLGLGVWLVWLPTQIRGATVLTATPVPLALQLPEPTATHAAASTATAAPVRVISTTTTAVVRPGASASPPRLLPTVSAVTPVTASPAHLATVTPLHIPTLAAPTTYVVQPGDTLTGIALSFEIEPLDLMITNQIANADQIQVGQILTIPAGGLARPRTAAAVAAPKKAIVSLSEQRLYAYQGDQNVYTFVVSTGRGGGTLTGNYSILDKTPNAYSAVWGFWMPYWMGIYYVGNGTLENGFHSLPVLASGEQIWGDALGTPVSYGCVVLGPTDAKLFYEWAEIGMPVIVQY